MTEKLDMLPTLTERKKIIDYMMSNGKKNHENGRFSVKKDFIAHVLIQRIPQLWGGGKETEEKTN
jgi:hypothetical protein